MSKYIIQVEVDQVWFDILGQITRHQDGFVWLEVKEESRVVRTDSNGERFLGDD